MGKFLAGFIVLAAIIGGGAMYYLQVYAFYEPVKVSQDVVAPGTVQMRLTSLTSELPETILIDDFEGIDADSSPLRFRACFTTPHSIAMLSETFVSYDDAIPLFGPRWFGCFDAVSIGNDLAEGKAVAFLSEANIIYGIDRVIAVYDDGRAFAWHQINECGAVVFDGDPAPAGCPQPPERSN